VVEVEVVSDLGSRLGVVCAVAKAMATPLGAAKPGRA
jgi:hypothetical protein